MEKQTIDGKLVDKEIRFDDILVGSYGTKEDEDKMNLKLLEESGYPETKKHIISINPHLFSKFKYLVRIDPEEMFPKNSETMQALLTSLYQLVRADPLINSEALVKELMNSYFRGKGENFINKELSALPPAKPEISKSEELTEKVRKEQVNKIMQGVGVA